MINHLEHLEDLIFTQGYLGGMKINNHLWSIQHGQANISTKWDGSPSIFAGWQNNEFFVSTKSFLNKTPKKYISMRDIFKDDSLDIDLRFKLVECFRELESVVPKGVILQGDLLFTEESLKSTDDLILFHPNTIVYGIPKLKWSQSWRLGVVWHTWISSNGKISNPRFGNMLNSDRVLSIDPGVNSYEIQEDIVNEPTELFKDINSTVVDYISQNKVIKNALMRAFNKILKDNKSLSAYDVFKAAENILISDANKLKTKAGIDRKLNQAQEHLDIVSTNFNEIYKFQESIRAKKRIIINRLDSYTKIKTFISINDQLHNTSHEGYVVFGESESVKIVDRTKFSTYNFSANIDKGWERQ